MAEIELRTYYAPNTELRPSALCEGELKGSYDSFVSCGDQQRKESDVTTAVLKKSDTFKQIVFW